MSDRSWAAWLAELAVGIDRDRIPERVLLHARYVWLDTVGVILAGSLEPEVTALADGIVRMDGQATVLRPTLPGADVDSAVLLNGVAGTTLELDEGHRPTGHPAIYTIPAVLAVAESLKSDAGALLEGLIAGYEVAARLAGAVSWREEVHVHGALAGVAAAAGVARVMQFSPGQTEQAIRVAASLSLATPFEAAPEGTLVRNAYAGIAAMVGLWSVRLVTAGFNGPVGGVNDVYTRLLGTEFRLEDLQVDPDEYLITSNYFKLHAACRYLHSAIDAVDLALDGRVMTDDEVQGIRVRCDANALRCAGVVPHNPLAAKFSLAYAVAARIISGGAGPDAFREPALGDPAIRALAERVSIEEYPPVSGEDAWPDYPAGVEIRLRSGERLVGDVQRPRGDQPDPVTYVEVERKFLELTEPVFGPGRAQDALDLVLWPDQVSGLQELMTSLRTLVARGLRSTNF